LAFGTWQTLERLSFPFFFAFSDLFFARTSCVGPPGQILVETFIIMFELWQKFRRCLGLPTEEMSAHFWPSLAAVKVGWLSSLASFRFSTVFSAFLSFFSVHFLFRVLKVGGATS